MASVGTVVIELDANTVKLINGIKKTEQKVDGLKRSMQNAKKQIADFAVAAAGIYATAKSFSYLKDTFSELEDKTVGVAKTTGLAGEELKRLRKELNYMSTTMSGFEIGGLLDIAEAAGQLGIKGVGNISKFTKEVQKIAITTDLTAAEAGVAFARILNVLKEDVNDLSKVSSAFNELSNNTTATVGDLLNFSQRIAGVGTTVGLSTEQILGLSATLKDMGINFETGGTAISKMLMLMQSNMEGFAAVSGVSMKEYAKTLKDEPIKALELFLAQLGRLDNQTKIKVLNNLKLGGTEASSVLLKLSSDLKSLEKNINIASDAYRDGTSIDKEYTAASKTLSAETSKLTSNLKLLSEKLFKEVEPGFRSMISGLSSLATTISKNIDGLKQLAIVIGEVALAYIALNKANKIFIAYQAGTGIIGLTKSVIAMGSFARSMVAAKIATIAFNKVLRLSPWGLAISGAVALAEGIRKIYNNSLEREELAKKWVSGAEARAQEKALQHYYSLGKELNNNMAALDNLKKSMHQFDKGSVQYKAIEAAASRLTERQKELRGEIDKLAPTYEKAVKTIKKSKLPKLPTDLEKDKDAIEAAKKAAQDAAKAMDEYLTLTSSSTDNQMRELGNKLSSLGKYLSQAQLAEIYEAEIKKMSKSNIGFTDQFKGLLKGLFSGDILGAFKGFFDGLTTQLIQPFVNNISDKLSGSLTKLVGGGDLFGIAGLGSALAGFAITAIGSLFGSESEPPPVLEDIARTSDSMANALDNIYDAEFSMLTLTRDMRGYLSIIANSFGAIENSLLRSNIDFAGAFYQPTTKSGALGFSSKDYSLFGTTLDFEAATIAEIMAEDLRVVSDTIIKKVYDSFWKTKTTYFHNYRNVSDLFAQDIADATEALFLGFSAIADSIGINVEGMLNEVIDIGKIDTTGKSDAEIAQEIEARFSAQTDAIAEQYLGVVAEFQRAGEGLAETAFRVAMTFDQVSHSMELIGKTVDWRTANIIEVASGGLDGFNASMKSYMDNFFTDQEQYEMQLNTMTKSFASLGLEIPDSKEEFRSLVTGIDTTTDAGAELFAEVISLADGFAELKGNMGSVEDMIKNVADAWLGNLSYLTLQQKAAYASGYLSIASDSQGAISSVDAAKAAAEIALKTTATKEEYIPIFERYIQELSNEAPGATTDDVVARLDTLIQRVRDLEEATTNASIYA